MDERLEKALEFANYRITLSNQKRNVKARMLVLQTVHENNSIFVADQLTISFVNALLASGKTSEILNDTKDNPIEIKNLQEFQDLLISAYTEATNEYKIQTEKLSKARSIKKIMDW